MTNASARLLECLEPPQTEECLGHESGPFATVAVPNEALLLAGFSPNESKVYTCLLSCGEATIARIAQETGLHRANVYDSLKKLVEKGHSSCINRENVSHYQANEPETILHCLKEKEDRFRQALPGLALMARLCENKPCVREYAGIPALMASLHRLIPARHPILINSLSNEKLCLLGSRWQRFNTERASEKVWMYLLIGNVKRASKCHVPEYDDRLSESRTIQHLLWEQSTIIVSGDDVIIVLWSRNPTSVCITSQPLAQSMKMAFSYAWQAGEGIRA